MTRATLLAAAVVLFGAPLAACSNLPEIAADLCGNGVVEAGEECDGDAGAAGGTCGAVADGDNACHFVCAGGASCPAGYACGDDARCRAPSAIFVPAPGPYPFDGGDLAAGDVDGDHIDDLVGVGASALTVRFGNPAADLFHAESQPIRTPVAHSVFGDLDGDARLDVIIPSSVGVFSFLAVGQGFNPYPYTSISLDDTTSPARTAAVEVVPDPFSEMLAMIGKTMAYINTKPQYAVCIDGGSPPLCLASQHTVADLLGDTLPTGHTGYLFGAVTKPEDDFTQEVVIAFKNDDHVALWSPTAPVVSGQTVDESTLSLEKLQTLALPKQGPLGTQLRLPDTGTIGFGQFDKDGCVDLLIPTHRVDAGGRFEGLAIAYGSKIGSVCLGKLDPPVVVVEAAIDTGAVTRGLLPRAFADLDGDGLTDVVTNALIAVTSCTRDDAACAKPPNNTFALDFRSFTPRTWTAAVATDVNHDGKPDLAGIVDGQDDVDVMIGAGLGFMNRFQIPTTLPPRAVRTGDFDGDLFLDVAVVVGDTTLGDAEDDHLEVLFGAAAGGPSAPVDMGSFGVIQDLAPISLFTDLESLDFTTDMIVIAARGPNRGVAPLIGSSTRRLLAPYLLGEGDATAQIRDTPVAIQLGQFDGGALPDVIALAHLVPQQSPTSGTSTGVDLTPRIFTLSGTGDGNLVGGQPWIPSAKIGDFEYRDALWAAGRMNAAATADSVIGVDATDARHTEVSAKSPHLFVATPPASAGGDWTMTATDLPDPYKAMRVHAIRLTDLDGDGDADLIVEMTGGGIDANLHVKTAAFVAWNENGTIAIAHPTAVYAAGALCRGAAPIQADLAKGLELAAVCADATGGGALTIHHYDGAAWKVAGPPLPIGGSDPQVVAGDFNGDRVGDLAITAGTGPSASVQLFQQCPLGDTACATRTQASTQGGN
jgi:hypothetical protein